MKTTDHTSHPQYIYVLRPSRPEMLTAGPTEREAVVIGEHAAYLVDLTSRNILLMAGRTQTIGPDTMGLAIIQAPSEAEAAEIMKNDPAVKHGVMTATLHPYEIAFGTLKPQDAR